MTIDDGSLSKRPRPWRSTGAQRSRRKNRLTSIASIPASQAIALASAITLVNAVWVLRDHTTASWDQSHYLNVAWIYQEALDHHGLVSMVRAIYATDPGRAPLLSVALVPFAYLFGSGPRAGLALNLALWPVLLLSAGAVAKKFGGHGARLLAMIIIAPMPLLVSLSHNVLQDFLLTTLACLGVWTLLRTRGFERTAWSAGLGLVIAAGTLTKFSFVVVGLAGPLLVVVAAALVRRWPTRLAAGYWRSYRAPLLNGSLTITVGLVLSLLWYVPNWAATKAYLKYAFDTTGTVAHPLALDNLKLFVNSLFTGMSWLAVGLALVVLIASLPRLLRVLRERADAWNTIFTASFLGLWFLVPVIAVAVSTNQDPRYCVTAYPAAGVIIAVLAMRSTVKIWRHAIVVVAVLVAVTQTLQINFRSYRVPGLPDYVTFGTPVGEGVIAFTGADGPAGLPVATDSALNMVKYLESISRGSSGRVEPRAVAILELDGWANGNNLPYYAAVRGDPFTFVTLLGVPPSKLTATLRRYDYAIYIQPPPAAMETALGRVAELNAVAASYEMTPAQFAVFKPHPAHIYIGADSGQSSYAEILVNRSIDLSPLLPEEKRALPPPP